jgi:hypothetical protein
MRFQINEIRVKNKIPCPDQFTFLQRLAIKWLNIPIEPKFNYEFILSSYKEGYLIPGMVVFLSAELANQCYVLSHNPNDKMSVIISPTASMTKMQARLLCTSKEGASIGCTFPESNFKRKKYAA